MLPDFNQDRPCYCLCTITFESSLAALFPLSHLSSCDAKSRSSGSAPRPTTVIIALGVLESCSLPPLLHQLSSRCQIQVLNRVHSLLVIKLRRGVQCHRRPSSRVLATRDLLFTTTWKPLSSPSLSCPTPLSSHAKLKFCLW